MYVRRKELREEILAYQKTGVVSEKLGEVLLKIAEGVQKRISKRADDDLTMEAVLQCLSKLHLIDAEMNVFSYLTQIAKTALYREYRKENRKKQILIQYINSKKDSFK